MAGRASEDEISKLFSSGPDIVPSVPISSNGGDNDEPSPSDPPGFGSSPSHLRSNTLDESVWETLKRDFWRIGGNISIVLFPCYVGRERSTALRNWDLWGPLIFMLSLSIIVVSGQRKSEQVFPIVFATLGFGAVVLTLNVVLLGGTIVFFQSLCLLGYCLFPLVLSAIACTILPGYTHGSHVTLHMLIRFLVVLAAVVWASWATLPFISESVPRRRRMLAVYPVLLLYTAIGWMEFFRPG